MPYFAPNCAYSSLLVTKRGTAKVYFFLNECADTKKFSFGGSQILPLCLVPSSSQGRKNNILPELRSNPGHIVLQAATLTTRPWLFRQGATLLPVPPGGRGGRPPIPLFLMSP